LTEEKRYANKISQLGYYFQPFSVGAAAPARPAILHLLATSVNPKVINAYKDAINLKIFRPGQ